MAREPVLAAGGIVLRRGQSPRIAVVRLRKRDEWVLPKGHIDPGEAPKDTAVREVREETGVVARVVGAVAGTFSFKAKGEDVRALCFLMEYLRETAADETREMGWFPPDTALAKLTHEESRAMLHEAERLRAGG